MYFIYRSDSLSGSYSRIDTVIGDDLSTVTVTDTPNDYTLHYYLVSSSNGHGECKSDTLGDRIYYAYLSVPTVYASDGTYRKYIAVSWYARNAQ